MKLSQIFSVRKSLSYLLILSILYAAHSIYFKVKYWGFSFSPKEMTDVWTVDAKISFDAVDDKTRVVLSVPSQNNHFNILSEEVVANGYGNTQDREKNRVIFC